MSSAAQLAALMLLLNLGLNPVSARIACDGLQWHSTHWWMVISAAGLVRSRLDQILAAMRLKWRASVAAGKQHPAQALMVQLELAKSRHVVLVNQLQARR